MLRRVREVLVGCQQGQPVTDAELRNQGVHSANLPPRTTAPVAQLCRSDVIFAIRLYEGKGAESLDYRGDGLGAREPLKQLLHNESGCHDHVGAREGFNKGLNFRRVGRCVSAKRQRPDACIDKQTHFRDRSAL